MEIPLLRWWLLVCMGVAHLVISDPIGWMSIGWSRLWHCAGASFAADRLLLVRKMLPLGRGLVNWLLG